MAALLLNACGNPVENKTADNITPATYTTTVSGKVTTPAGKAIVRYSVESGRTILVPYAEDALVWASTALAKKVNAAPDGSYTLEVAGHGGSFTITASYPQGPNHNYKTSDPQTVNTTASTHTQNIALNYRYRTTISGKVGLRNSTTALANVTVTLQVEGRDVATTVTDSSGEYSVTIDHNGSFFAIFSTPGRPRRGTNGVSSSATTYTLNRTGASGLEP